MKPGLILCQLLFLMVMITSSCEKTTYGCKDATATNYDVNADEGCNGCCTFPPKKGALIFWIGDVGLVAICGPITITLDNGQSSNIRFGLLNAPVNCVNTVGGYFYVEEGTYSYTIKGNCDTFGTGTVKVLGNTCNIEQLF